MLFERFMCLDADLLKLKTDLFVAKEEFMDKIFYPDSKASKRHPVEDTEKVNENVDDIQESESMTENTSSLLERIKEITKDLPDSVESVIRNRTNNNPKSEVVRNINNDPKSETVKSGSSIESSINELKGLIEEVSGLGNQNLVNELNEDIKTTINELKTILEKSKQEGVSVTDLIKAAQSMNNTQMVQPQVVMSPQPLANGMDFSTLQQGVNYQQPNMQPVLQGRPVTEQDVEIALQKVRDNQIPLK